MDRHDANADRSIAPSPGVVESSPLVAGEAAESPPRFDPWGRRLTTFDELPRRLQLLAGYEGKWVAWDADQANILAAAERLGDLDRQIQALGSVGAIYEWIDPPYRQVTRL